MFLAEILPPSVLNLADNTPEHNQARGGAGMAGTSAGGNDSYQGAAP